MRVTNHLINPSFNKNDSTFEGLETEWYLSWRIEEELDLL